MIFTFYQIMFTFSRMSDFPKVLDWNQGLVSNLFCVCQLSLQLVIWLVSWSFTVTGAKKPSTLVTKRWAHAQPFPVPHNGQPFSPPQTFFLSLFSCFWLFSYLIFVLNECYLLKKIGSDLYFQSQDVNFTYTSTGTHQEFYLVFFCGKTGSRFLYWL